MSHEAEAGHSPAQLKASKRQMDTVGAKFNLISHPFFLAPQGPKS